MKSNLLLTMLAGSIFTLVTSLPASADTAREIMAKVNKIARESYSSTYQKREFNTCARFSKKDKKIVCKKGNTRKIVLESFHKAQEVGSEEEEMHSIFIPEKGPHPKAAGMLLREYADPHKDAYFMICLSKKNFGSRRRCPNEKGPRFFGTEFALEDMEASKTEHYTYRILKETEYRKRPVWIIESLPTLKRARKIKYGKSMIWVDKERYIKIKVQLWNRQGKRYKQIDMADIKRIDNVWVSGKIRALNVRERRFTIMRLISVTFNIEISDAIFDTRILTHEDERSPAERGYIDSVLSPHRKRIR